MVNFNAANLSAPELRARLDPSHIPQEITDWEQEIYERVISANLNKEQIERLVNPQTTYPRQEAILAVHWHPEFIPIEIILNRINVTFPNAKHSLIIPTQHNELMSVGDYSGVEIDCYSPEFNRKVQLLAHFKKEKLERSNCEVFLSMLAHTFKYRASQLFQFLAAVVDPQYDSYLQKAAAETGANEETIKLCRAYCSKIKTLIEINEAITPEDAIKNKLVRNYFDELRARYEEKLINRAQLFLRAIKQIVKANFSLQYFYETQAVIEEIRGLGGGIVIPHPEQFWPILLAGYDVDGYEVWNPQSREYTEFLINALNRENKSRSPSQKRLLVFMGDDTHMGEKAKDPLLQDPEKAGREIGVQPAWEDFGIRKSLITANVDRRKIIDEYRERLE